MLVEYIIALSLAMVTENLDVLQSFNGIVDCATTVKAATNHTVVI